MFQYVSTLECGEKTVKKRILQVKTEFLSKHCLTTHPFHFSVWKIHQAFPVKTNHKASVPGKGAATLAPQAEGRPGRPCCFTQWPGSWAPRGWDTWHSPRTLGSLHARGFTHMCTWLVSITCVFLNSFSSIFFSFLSCLKSWICLTAASLFKECSEIRERERKRIYQLYNYH